MESEFAELGDGASSNVVASVKELTKEPLIKVPERYVREDIESPDVSNKASLPKVPVIDLSKLLSEDASQTHELEKLDRACKEWGFFQVTNHGVSLAMVENVKKGARELFNLTMEQKSKLWRKPGDMEGFGQMFDVSEEQKLDWVDMFYMFTLPSYLRKPHLFPNIPQPLRDDLEDYCVQLRELAIKILHLMAKALTMDSKDIEESFGEGGQSIRINYYPPCPQPENVLGLSAHTDASTLTILLQANEVEGLHIRKDGMWIPVEPLSHAFVVSIGDVLEIVTNGLYRSIEHRATVNSHEERLSIAMFYGPGSDGTIGPAPSLVTPQTPALFKTVSVAEYYDGYLSSKHRNKSYIDVIRIQYEDGKSS